MSAPLPLMAVRQSLDSGPPIDPYALAGSDGILFDTGRLVLVGIGRALTITLPDGLGAIDVGEPVRRALGSITVADSPKGAGFEGSPVLAFGAIPFDRTEPAELVVPAVVYCRQADGQEWVTVVGDGTSLANPRAHLAALQQSVLSSETQPEHLAATVEPRSSELRFLDMVASALTSIEAGSLSKVVLARQVDLRLDEPLYVAALLHRWRALEPNCTVFSMPVNGGQFVGASPELLVALRGNQVTSRPLAGTRRHGDADDDTLLRGSSKDAREHRLVVEAIGATLLPLCSTLDVPLHPELVHLHNIVHLGTTIRGELRADLIRLHRSAFDLMAELHPTPAVGGVPRDASLRTIARLEADSRGHYAGPVGYVDADGNGEWMVGIRAATLRDRSARLAAGVGIVEGSEASVELEETELKFAAVFNAIAPGIRLTTIPSDSAV